MAKKAGTKRKTEATVVKESTITITLKHMSDGSIVKNINAKEFESKQAIIGELTLAISDVVASVKAVVK